MAEVFIIYKPVHWFAEQISGLVSIYDKDLRYERVKKKLLGMNIQYFLSFWVLEIIIRNIDGSF